MCLSRRVPLLLARGLVRLLVVDSVAALFRCEFQAADWLERTKQMLTVSSTLHHLSQEFSTPVLCINQVKHSCPLNLGHSCWFQWFYWDQTPGSAAVPVSLSGLNPIYVSGDGCVQQLRRQFGVKTISNSFLSTVIQCENLKND